jgi:hypothetical protein
VSQIVAETAAERLSGGRPSRTHSLFAAVAAGLVVGVTTYKLLRSGGRSASD